MGQVVPFIARMRDSGDWTAAERARLEELAERLAAGGVHVEVIFGATDEGDPWCVVTDADGDVLIHVARIDGKFVVHSAVDDAVGESVDLHTALRDHLAATEEAMAPRTATILPFGLSARQGQTFLALLAATAFFYETAAIGDTAEAGEPIQALPPADDMPPAESETPAQEREAAQSVALQPAAQSPTPQLAPTPAMAAAPNVEDPDAPPPPVEFRTTPPTREDVTAASLRGDEARVVVQGTDGDDLLVGTAANEHILGGDGNDTLRGGGGNDLLDGGAGDDVIEVTGQVTAIGGEGADTFVLAGPAQGGPERLLGVILDFSNLDGDRVTGASGEAVRFRPQPPTDGSNDRHGPDNGFTTTLVPRPPPPTDPLTPPGGGDGEFGTTLVGGPLVRVEVDLDGDGVADGYILVGVRGAPEPPPINTTVGAGLGTDPLI